MINFSCDAEFRMPSIYDEVLEKSSLRIHNLTTSCVRLIKPSHLESVTRDFNRPTMSRNCFVLLLTFLFPAYILFYLRFSQTKPLQSAIEPQELWNTSETLINSTIAPSTAIPKPAVWDDGKGYEFVRRRSKLKLNPDYDILRRLPPCGVQVQYAADEQMERVKFQFMGCVPRIVEQWRGRPHQACNFEFQHSEVLIQMITDWTDKVKFCDDLPELKALDLVPFDNLQKIEWAILPKCVSDNYYHQLINDNDL